MHIRSFKELTAADPRSLRFTPYGLALDGELSAADAARYQVEQLNACDLVREVPTTTARAFERVRDLHAYGALFYDAFTVAHDLSDLTLELALRERFLIWYQQNPAAIKHKKSGRTIALEITTWDQIDEALHSGRDRAPWLVSTRSGDMDFTGNVKTLLAWARGVELLPGHRSRGMDALLHEARIRAGHLSYHLLTPVDSVRAIKDLAEIINQLWGHPTPGGRLFPGPITVEPIIISWPADGMSITVARRDQFDAWDPLPDEECVIVAGNYDDRRLTAFDSWYERTSYPTSLLWGPGSLVEARAWLDGRRIELSPLSTLDRLFAVKFTTSSVDLPMRVAVAAALDGQKADGCWVLVRADHPDDAFRHATNRSAGRHCVRLDETPRDNNTVQCSTEEVYEGDHRGLQRVLKEHGLLPQARGCDLSLPPHVRVPS